MNKSLPKEKDLIEEFYRKVFGPFLSKDEGIEAEKLTNFALKGLNDISLYREWYIINKLIFSISKKLKIKDSKLSQNLFNCQFENPLGLAAGFDKNGVAAGIWDKFGFGFAELGTVTFHPQEGNPKPRLFRLAKEQAALNRMGFNNKGACNINKILSKQNLPLPGNRQLILGINLGKSKITPLNEAYKDYVSSLNVLGPFADYIVINVSSPNTKDLRKLQEEKPLRNLIQKLKETPLCPPILVKISPDLDNESIEIIAQVAKDESINGIIAVNTSLNRLGLEKRILTQTGNLLSKEDGGLSGKPLEERALEVIKILYKTAGKEIILIGVGGIDSPRAAWERITAGASLIQIYTGWIYQGPMIVPLILKGLIKQLEMQKFNNISEAIGSNSPWIDE